MVWQNVLLYTLSLLPVSCCSLPWNYNFILQYRVNLGLSSTRFCSYLVTLPWSTHSSSKPRAENLKNWKSENQSIVTQWVTVLAMITVTSNVWASIHLVMIKYSFISNTFRVLCNQYRNRHRNQRSMLKKWTSRWDSLLPSRNSQRYSYRYTVDVKMYQLE